ncbi:MAG: SMP-30/gluconolactonase/LRE family protein, partial [Afipia sp.]|nr:SMP-30/gluconolactonase/LRE family protein [Afipia sp.]
TLYFSDSRAATIWASDWNAATGEIFARRVFSTVTEAQGRPDGAAMDSDGHYWSAGVSAGRLNRFAPDGRLVETIGLPVRAPTMPAFGPDGTLFVTSHRRIPVPTDDDGCIVLLPTKQRGVKQPRFAMT